MRGHSGPCSSKRAIRGFIRSSSWRRRQGAAAVNCSPSSGPISIFKPVARHFEIAGTNQSRSSGKEYKIGRAAARSGARVGARGHRATPSRARERPRDVRPRLRRQRSDFLPARGAILFAGSTGRSRRRVHAQSGLQGVSLHSLRHSHASILLSKGVPIAVVSERLGHATRTSHYRSTATRCQRTHARPRRFGMTRWRR